MQRERTRIQEKREVEEKLSPVLEEDLLSLHILDQSHFRRKLHSPDLDPNQVLFHFSLCPCCLRAGLSRKLQQPVLWIFLRPGPRTRGDRDGEKIRELWFSERLTEKKTRKRWVREGEDEGGGRHFCCVLTYTWI